MKKQSAEKAVKYAELSGKALGFAIKIAEEAEKQQRAADERVPAAVERLKKAGLIESHDAKRAAESLGRHADAVDILINVVDHYEQSMKKQASLNLGSPVDEPSVSGPTRDKYANYAGYRRGQDDPPAESDQALLRLVGGR